MITIMIISILAAAVLGVAAVAGETAREAKTRNVVARIHTLLMEQYGTYASRRIKFRRSSPPARDGIEDQIDDQFPSSSTRRNHARSEARLYAMRELMLMEVPDRWSDVYLADLSVSQPGQPFYYGQRTELSNLYLRRYQQLNPTKENESAECLYLVIMNACGDGEARTLFPESNIGDTDGDGAPEFIDGWGHPINFLRWAPGFNSDVQLSADKLFAMIPADQALAIAGDHDPFDLFRVDSQAFRLIPLVYSNGRDETSGVDHEDNYVTWRTSASNAMTFAATQPLIRSPQLTPYVPIAPNRFVGSPDQVDPVAGRKTATDNIHNHLIGTR
jgi:type II secretory pathway pseudopilin PulG